MVQGGGAPLGTVAGVFRGDIIATTTAELPLHGELDRDLGRYAIAPLRYGERSPNVLRRIEIDLLPIVSLARSRPRAFGRATTASTSCTTLRRPSCSGGAS